MLRRSASAKMFLEYSSEVPVEEELIPHRVSPPFSELKEILGRRSSIKPCNGSFSMVSFSLMTGRIRVEK